MAESEIPSTVIDLETGLPVEFTRAVWNYNDDIALKRIVCYDSLESDGIYTQNIVFGKEEFYPQIFPETRSVYYWTSFNDNAGLLELSFSESFTVTEGSGEIFESAFVEVVEAEHISIRIWYETSNIAHKRCGALDHNYMPTDLAPTGGNTEETTVDGQATGNNCTDTENDTSAVTGNDKNESQSTDTTSATVDSDSQQPMSSGGSGGGAFTITWLLLFVGLNYLLRNSRIVAQPSEEN